MGKKNSKSQDKLIGMFPLEFQEAKVNDPVSIPDVIHIVPIGQWEHDLYGPILINNADIREFVQNFNAGIRKGVFITAGHEGWDELPAVGWFKELEVRDDGLWGSVEWNQNGKDALSDKQFKFFSPEFYRDYEDPETHQIYRNVLTGGALTKSPYFKELQAVIASEGKKEGVVTFSDKKISQQFSNNENDMDLKALLAKPVADLTAEEKAFIVSSAAELTEEEKVSHASVLETPVVETEEEKTAREEKEAGDANEAAGLNRDGSVKSEAPEGEAGVQASEKVMITAGELAKLREAADQGKAAFKELEGNKITASVTALTFSATNKAGKFLPKSETKVRAFMESLKPEQRLAFSALIGELPGTQVFKEVGAGTGAADGTARAEVDAKVDAKISAAEKAGKPMKYSDALKEVMSENKGLEERYDGELPSAKKVTA